MGVLEAWRSLLEREVVGDIGILLDVRAFSVSWVLFEAGIEAAMLAGQWRGIRGSEVA